MWWVNFRRGGDLTGVALIEAPTIFHARMRLAVHGIGNPADFSEGKEVDAECAALVPRESMGRLLLPDEAQKLRPLAPDHMESLPQLVGPTHADEPRATMLAAWAGAGKAPENWGQAEFPTDGDHKPVIATARDRTPASA
jgi:hypothetical protein